MQRHDAASRTSFLSLPEELRYRIYKDARLITGALLRIVNPSALPQQRRRWSNLQRIAVLNIIGSPYAPLYAVIERKGDNDRGLQTYCNLRVSSREILADIRRYLHSRNDLLLCCADYEDLSLLLDMPRSLVVALKSLSIHIDFASPHTARCRYFGRCCHRQWGEATNLWSAHYENDYKPIQSAMENFEAFINLWRRAIAYLVSCADNSKLQIRLYANVDDSAAAEAIVQPLEEGDLAVCIVRFGSMQDPSLQSIASRLVNTTGSARQQTFRFLGLPPELRRRILSFTDLVTSKRICVKGGAFSRYRAICEPSSSCPTPEFCCLDHSCHPPSIYYDIPQYPLCDCWKPPTPMFLVCKDMLRDARALFFSANHFMILPSSRTEAPKQQFECSYFIRQVVPEESLWSLRNLELFFPAFRHGDPLGSDKATYDDWKETINYMGSRIKKLKLYLHMGSRDYFGPELAAGDELQSIQPLFNTQFHIVQPLQALRCLDLFLVRAYSPFYKEDAPDFKAELREHERQLEDLVMGEKREGMLEAKSDFERKEWWLSPGTDALIFL